MSGNKKNGDISRGEPPAPGREEETVGSKQTETLQLPPLPLRGRAGTESDNESVYSGSSNRSADSLDDVLECKCQVSGCNYKPGSAPLGSVENISTVLVVHN